MSLITTDLEDRLKERLIKDSKRARGLVVRVSGTSYGLAIAIAENTGEDVDAIIERIGNRIEFEANRAEGFRRLAPPYSPRQRVCSNGERCGTPHHVGAWHYSSNQVDWVKVLAPGRERVEKEGWAVDHKRMTDAHASASRAVEQAQVALRKAMERKVRAEATVKAHKAVRPQ